MSRYRPNWKYLLIGAVCMVVSWLLLHLEHTIPPWTWLYGGEYSSSHGQMPYSEELGLRRQRIVAFTGLVTGGVVFLFGSFGYRRMGSG